MECTLHLAVCILGCKPRAVLIFGASRGSIFSGGSWSSSPLMNAVSRARSSLHRIPQHLAGWGIGFVYLWTGLFTMGYYNPSWLTTFFPFQVYFFCWAAPCVLVPVNRSPRVASWWLQRGRARFLSPHFCSGFTCMKLDCGLSEINTSYCWSHPKLSLNLGARFWVCCLMAAHYAALV